MRERTVRVAVGVQRGRTGARCVCRFGRAVPARGEGGAAAGIPVLNLWFTARADSINDRGVRNPSRVAVCDPAPCFGAAPGGRSMSLQRPKPALPGSDKRWKLVNATMRRNGYAGHALIEALHSVQDAFGFLDETAMTFVAESLDLPLSKVYGVATFYHLFMLEPKGRHACVVCTGTACYIKGAGVLVDRIAERFDVRPGGTTEDGALSVLSARCVGACGLAPAVVVDGEMLGKQSADALLAKLEGLDT